MRRWIFRFRALWIAFALMAVAAIAIPDQAAGGQGSWTRLDLETLQVNTMAVDPNDSNALFAGTNGQGIYRSTDGGANWVQVNTGLANLYVNDILIDPRNTNILLAGAGRGSLVGEPGGGVYRSTDRGTSWTRVLDAGTIWALALTPQNPDVMYAAGGPPVFKSTDGGVTWSEAFEPGSDLANIEARGVTVHPTDASVVLVAGNTEGGNGQVYRTEDAGGSWDRVTAGQAPILDVKFVTDLRVGVLAFFGNLVGVFRSTDGGQSWQRVTDQLGDIQVNRVQPDPSNGNRVSAGTNQGVYRSTNSGIDWTQVDTTLGNQQVHGLGYDRAAPQTLYAGTEDGAWAYTFTAPPSPTATPLPTTPTPTPTPAPGGTVTWYFAEGSTQPPFDTWFLVQNPTDNTATVRFTFELESGQQVSREATVGPRTRYSLFVNQVLPNAAFSTRVEADQKVFVERSMFVGFDGSSITGIAGPNKEWLFAEGATVSPFDSWVLLQNPGDSPANTTITYLLPNQAPVTQSLGALAPHSRTSVYVNQVLPNQEFSIKVSSDQAIIAERSMFRFPGNSASATAGTTQANRSWYFAEGSSENGTDSFLLLQNPGSSASTVGLTLYSTTGEQRSLQIGMPGNSRRTIYLNQIFPGASFGVKVDSSEAIVAERSMFFGSEPKGFTGSMGSPSLATTWNMPEGSTQTPFTTVLAVLNPNDSGMSVRMDFQLESGQVVSRDFTVGPGRKLSVEVNQILASAAFSTKVTTSLPSVVERTMFFQKQGGRGATNAIGIE